MPLDIRRLQRGGALTPGRSCGWHWTVNNRERGSIQIRAEASHVTLSYSYAPRGQPAESINQTVLLDTTPCTLGGNRSWFICPVCARRVAVIYGAGRLFACRHCKGLAYTSQAEDVGDRAARKADRIRKRLGWRQGILNPRGAKPKGMHWTTFWRLSAEHDALAQTTLSSIVRKLGLPGTG